MLSTVLAAAFAAGAVAVPFQKRELITNVDVVYYTDVVTVTVPWGFGSTQSSSLEESSSATSSTPSSTDVEPATSTSVAPTSTSTPVAPTTSTSVEPTTSTSVEPTTSTSVAPITSVDVAPTTDAAPSNTSVEASSTTDKRAASSTPSNYAERVLLHHNIHRANHSAPLVGWDHGLAASAATIAASCVYAHNTAVNGGGYGQNIAAGVPPQNVTAVITDLFYNGEMGWYDGYYGEAQPSMTYFENWGHFSQIVWKSTTHVGCATHDCSAQGLSGVGSNVAPYFTVCNYGTPGNYANEYGANVLPPLGHATAQWNYGLGL